MTYSKHSSRSAEEIEKRLREAAQQHKFGVLHVLDLTTTLRSKGIDFKKECRIYDVCNPQAASKALNAEMQAATVLPCRIAVFADDRGYTVSTVRPTDLLKATGIKAVENLAAEIEKEIVEIIDAAAA